MRVARLITIGCVMLLVALRPVFAQDDDDESKPGLIAISTNGNKGSAGVRPDIFYPSSRHTDTAPVLPGPPTSTWDGQLLLKAEGTFQFHAFVHGRLSVKLGDETVIEANTDQPQWVTGPKKNLGFGEYPLHAWYSAASSGSTGVKLFWSSDSFPLEPIPYHLLFHNSDDRQSQLAALGERQLTAFSCRRCSWLPPAHRCRGLH